MRALGTFFGQLAEHAAKQPGWTWLLILSYLVVSWADLPASVNLRGYTLDLSDEVVALLLTLALFVLGDSLDKVVYKPMEVRFHKTVDKARQQARARLQIHDGIYDVAKELASAAGQFQTFSIQWLNETAKFLRSLILPGVGLALGLAISNRPLAGLLFSLTILLVPLYVWLKAAHMRHLYGIVPALVGETKCHVEDLQRARLFFWDGVYVTGAVRARPAAG